MQAPTHPSNPKRWAGSSASYYLLLGLLVCCILALMVVVYQSADRASVVDSPLVDAAMEIKMETATAYLKLQEVLTGESQVPIDQVWAHFDQANWYAKAMLDGGTNAEGTFWPIENAQLRGAINDCRTQLEEFAEISRIWYQERLAATAESTTPKIYHERFLALLESVDRVETMLQRRIEGEVRSFHLSQVLMLMAILLLTMVACHFFIRLERKRKTYLAELEAARNDLEMRVEERTSKLTRLNQQLVLEVKDRCAAETALAKSEAALSQLLAAIMEAQDQERARIANELSEGIAQSITAANFALGAIMRKSGAEPGYDFKNALDYIQTALKDLRCLGDDLHPEILNHFGILETASWFCRNFQEAYPGIRVQHQSDLREDEIPQRLRMPIYRILQQALDHAANHSGADAVEVLLVRTGNGVALTISDNGCGIRQDRRPMQLHRASQIGIRSMQERARHSGGLFTLESPPGRRTLVRVNWVLAEETNASQVSGGQ